MARYPNQDFQQNISFKCTLEFRYALKLAMEKARARDLSTFIREHLDPAIHSLLDPLLLGELEELNSPVKIKEAARAYYRMTGCRRVVSAVRFMVATAVPPLERRVIEIGRAIRSYEAEARKLEESSDRPVLLRASMASVASELVKILKYLDKDWSRDTYSATIRIAADLPEDLSLDISHGLDFLSDNSPSIDKPYAVPPRLDPESAWSHVREEFARERPLDAAFVHSLKFEGFDGTTLTINAPHAKADRLVWLQSPRNREHLNAIIESYFGNGVILQTNILPPA